MKQVISCDGICAENSKIQRAAFKAESSLVTGNLDLRNIQKIPKTEKGNSLCPNCMNSVVCAKHQLSFQNSGVFASAR